MITGVLLLHMPPDQAFWLLAHIVEVLLPDYYSKSLTGSVVDQRIFNSIVSKHLPNLAEHLAEVGVMLDLITYGWFLCLFIGYVPWQVPASHHRPQCTCSTLSLPRAASSSFRSAWPSLCSMRHSLANSQDALMQASDPESVLTVLRDRVYDPKELLQITFADFNYGEEIRKMRATETQAQLKQKKGD